MFTDISFVSDAPRQLAILATPSVIRALIPNALKGVYMLLRDGVTLYVGRSDSCVQRRLVRHELLAEASYVAWEPCKSSAHSFLLEAAWFHRLHGSPRLRNLIHPAKPAGLAIECPFCGERDSQALAEMLRVFGH